MPSLLLVVFILQLVIHLVNTVGAPVINEFLWALYNRIPSSTSADVKAQTELQREVVRLKREMNATSSQDQFAKWAKLRRSHDKVLTQYDEITNGLKSFKAMFDRTVTLVRWFGTNGLRFLLQFWYAKRPLFWIPQGWVPGYVEWLLAFPRAPTGSVSIQIWGIACATAVQLVGAAVVAAMALAGEKEQEKQKMKMGAYGGDEKGEEKKEL